MVEVVHKVLLAGEGDTGKTEIFKRFSGYSFASGPTRAFNVAQKSIEGTDLHLQFFDLSGRKAYMDLRETFFRNASACVLVFDLSDKVSMFLLQDWLREIHTAFFNGSEGIHNNLPCLFIVGNKSDLRETRKRCLTTEEAQKFVERLKGKFKCDIKYLEVSAKDNKGINELISEISRIVKLTEPAGNEDRPDSQESINDNIPE